MSNISKPEKIPFGYLERQFEDIDPYLQDLKKVVVSTDLTLGKELTRFENAFAEEVSLKHVIGVASGTDAIMLALKIQGIGLGDEVITAANTFIATAGAIAMTGATPVFVDCEEGYVIDTDKIEAAITPKTKAIVPVHFTGNVADMDRVTEIAEKHGLIVVEDACQSILASIHNRPVGDWGSATCFSLHPLKNLNVWGDGGLIATNDDHLAEQLRLFRNHGLVDRDTVAFFGHNSRLDTLQAVIGNRLIPKLREITNRRIQIAQKFDDAFEQLDYVDVPTRRDGVRHVFHLYIIETDRRDELKEYLLQHNVSVKIHYPVPLHLQPASQNLGYKQGDFPVSEKQAARILTLPAHPYLRDDEVDRIIELMRSFR
ncbi:MAG: DegT/DnrJ/EryC1/StrS family aminotransferase [Opitutales bacterium]|nr:DegT/DnrJ/EryC1/StrS family aminotransferase [Opitutales bacterium]